MAGESWAPTLVQPLYPSSTLNHECLYASGMDTPDSSLSTLHRQQFLGYPPARDFHTSSTVYSPKDWLGDEIWSPQKWPEDVWSRWGGDSWIPGGHIPLVPWIPCPIRRGVVCGKPEQNPLNYVSQETRPLLPVSKSDTVVSWCPLQFINHAKYMECSLSNSFGGRRWRAATQNV